MAKALTTQKKEWDAIGIDRAQETRGALGLGYGPIADIFQLIEQQGILLVRYPSPLDELHAFYAEIDGYQVIYINSNEVLGRQIFSAAHELCHHFYDRDNLKSFLCDPGSKHDDKDQAEVIADAFAGEFLVPKAGVERTFHKYFGHPQLINETHVIKMQHYYKVSYAAMLYNMYKAGIIAGPTYGKLKKLGQIENAQNLREHIRRAGYSTELIDPTHPQYPYQFYDALVRNFQDELISYGKLESLLGVWGRTPEEFGFEKEEF